MIHLSFFAVFVSSLPLPFFHFPLTLFASAVPLFNLNISCFLVLLFIIYFSLFSCLCTSLVFLLKAPFLVQVKDCNKTVFFNSPLFSEISKVSVFCFASLCFLVCLFENTIKIVASENFQKQDRPKNATKREHRLQCLFSLGKATPHKTASKDDPKIPWKTRDNWQICLLFLGKTSRPTTRQFRNNTPKCLGKPTIFPRKN